MLVYELYIKNFRGIKEGRIKFGKNTMLVGANNTGKTTVIEAFALLFGRDRLLQKLTEHDFYGSTPNPEDRIKIIATITDFATSDIEHHPEWFRNRGIPKWMDNEGHLHPSQDESSWKLCVQVGLCARFDFELLEVETVRYFVDDEDMEDVFDEESYVSLPSGLLKEMGFFLVSASRTWDRMLSFSSELFRRVVNTVGSLPAESIINERNRLRVPDSKLEEQTSLQEIVNHINTELTALLPSPPSLKLRLTNTDSDSVLSTIVPHFESVDGYSLPAGRHGSGLRSLQSLLLLTKFGQMKHERGENFLLAIEEPELHIPPAQQQRLVNRLRACCNQTVVSTHSPLVAAMYPPEWIVFLRNNDGVLSSNPLSPLPLDQTATNQARQLMYIKRADVIEALMHETVLIPEGRTDYQWFCLLQTALEISEGWGEENPQCYFFGLLVGLIPTNDSKVVESYTTLLPAHKKLFCLVDGDGAGNGYRDQLKALATPPSSIIQWPQDWEIEDAIAWMLQADAASFALVSQMGPAGTSLLTFNEVRNFLHDSKLDSIILEQVCQTIADLPLCRQRAIDLMSNLAQSLSTQEATARFTLNQAASTVSTKVLEFHP